MQKYANLNNVSIHGLDIGNATLINSDGLILDAKITTVEPVKKADKVVINNETYYLGYGSYDTTFKKIEKENYLNMMYGLLALTTKTTYNYVGLGLPISQYNIDIEALKNLVLSNDTKNITLNNELEKLLIIKDVEVFPEGISTLEDDEECIVIDLGGGTCDCGLVINERDKRKVINPISIPKGTIKLYQEFSNKLNNKYGLDLLLEDAERILNRGYLFNKNENDINFALDQYKEFTEDIISRLQINYNLKTYPISLCGGGARMLYNQLVQRFKNIDIKLQPEPIKANARSFKELALSVFEGV